MRIVHLIDTFHWDALYQEGELASVQGHAGHQTWVVALSEVGQRRHLPFSCASDSGPFRLSGIGACRLDWAGC